MKTRRKVEKHLINPGQGRNQEIEITPPIQSSGSFSIAGGGNESNRHFPLTHAQKRIYYTEKLNPGTSCNTVVFTVRYDGELNRQLLEDAVNRVIRENEGLRLRLSQTGGKEYAGKKQTGGKEQTGGVTQYVSPYRHYPLDAFDFSAHSDEESLERWIENKTYQPFQIYDSRLFYFAYVTFNSEETGYLLKIHHIACDGWTINRLVTEIHRLYRALEGGETPEEAPRPSYLEYIEDERDYMDSEEAIQDRAFWHENLQPFPAENSSWIQTNQTADIKSSAKYLPIPSRLRERVLQYCGERRTSIFKLFLSAFAVYMSRRGGTDDVVIGSANHNRTTGRQKDMLGMFVSTIPLRIKLKDGVTFEQFVRDNGAMTNEILKKRQKYPFDLLATELREAEGADARQLLNVNMVGHPDVPERAFRMKYIFPGYEANPLTIHINLSNRNIHGVLELQWNYQEDLFTAEDIHRMHHSLTAILEDVLERPDKKLAEIEWIPEAEKERILSNFNAAAEESRCTAGKTLHGLFEEQAERTPDAPALVLSNGNRQANQTQITYKELNEISDRLAQMLRSRGVEPGAIVGIIVERSLEMIAGLLGILKTGAAYLPINPKTPPARTIYMLEDTGARVLLSKEGELSNTGEKTKERGWSGDIFNLRPNRRKKDNLKDNGSTLKTHDASNLAYLIYTSGSTGKPKGVLINHGNVSPLLHWGHRSLGIGPGDRVLQNISYIFDWSVWEMFITLVSGAALHIVPEAVSLSPKAQAGYIHRNNITVLHITPSQYRSVMDSGHRLESLRYLFLGAEKLTQDMVRRSYESVVSPGKCRIFNMYGPTEATIISNTHEVRPEDIETFGSQTGIPIGKPTANLWMAVVDRHHKMCPIGTPGELVIAGDGLARGYLNNPELTAEKFEQDLADLGDYTDYNRAYKTGDQVRWLEDGSIEFLGRIDHQVKIRGYRIELGEIENRLQDIEGIKTAVVLVKGADSLCAYYVPEEDFKLNARDIGRHMEKDLPGYMIPSYFVRLDRLPLTPNGKLDRARLPEPSETAAGAVEYIEPETGTEKKLADLWQIILEVDRVGLEDHFFRLGGHSLSAVNLNAAIHKAFNVDLTVPEIFAMPTLREQARHVDSASESNYCAIHPVEDKEYYPMSPAQKRMFVLSRIEGGGINYNVPTLMLVEGRLDPVKTARVLRRLIRRHESLRTSFTLVDGDPVQRIHWEVDFSLRYSNGHHKPVNEITRDFVKPFDLEKAPLFRVYLADIETGEQLFFIDMHHIISDKITLEILLKEFAELYRGNQLEPLTVRYRDYAVRQQEKKPLLEKQENYWLGEFSEEAPLLELPLDYPRPAVQDFDGGVVVFDIDPQKNEALRNLALREGATLFIVLLAAFDLFLAKLSGQEDIVVGTPVAGRRHADLEPIVGMFINTLALRSYPTAGKTFDAFLAEVRDRTLAAFDNQDYQFEDLVEKLSLQRDPARNPLFDASFALNKFELKAEAGKEDEFEFNLVPWSEVIRTSKFDLSLTADEMMDSEYLYFTLEYCTRLFDEETVRRFAGYFKQIIDEIISNPGRKISEMEIITEEEKQRVLYDFNGTEADYPREITAPELFRRQVEKTPDAAAAVTGMDGNCITYRELDEKSDYLAALLLEQGVQPDTIVGLKVEPSPEMIAAIWAILKSGAAYMPIDPNSPQERIDYMLKDSNAKVLIEKSKIRISKSETNTNEQHSNDQNKRSETAVLDLAHLDFEGVSTPDNFVHPAADLKPSYLAYIIYTSGSTGRPKGVMVEHGNLSSYINSFFAEFEVDSSDVFIQQASFCFDAFVEEFYPVQLRGGKLCIARKHEILDIQLLEALIDRHRVSMISCSPLLLNELNRRVPGALRTIHTYISGGDVLKKEYIDNLLKTAAVYNTYGPTEATVCATYYKCPQDLQGNVPIGKPIENYKVQVRDANGNLQPIGIPGELCISGEGITRGYLNRPELTADKYMSDKSYKTGDLVRWRPDGNIEFLGRIDHQVKIRGYRIELGEIETRLMQHESIEEAAVFSMELPPGSGNRQLCAYYVSEQPEDESSHSVLKAHLLKGLPGYMVPAYYVRLERLPRNTGGKVNRRALPPPSKEIETGTRFEAPVDTFEEDILQTWQEVLGIEGIGINDNLFDLGGNSILLIKIQSLMEQKYPGKVKVVDLFTHTTVSKLADYIRSQAPDEEGGSQGAGRTPRRRQLPETDRNGESELKDIAIIGVSLKIKDVETMEGLWQYLSEGKDCIGEIPEIRRKDIKALLRTSDNDEAQDPPAPLRFQESAYLEEIDKFDNAFFKLSPREAALMDPNQRLFLQTAWAALEDAGYGGNKLYGSDTGVFVGFNNEEENYRQLVATHAPADRMLALAGNIQSVIASRISYLMDFKGSAKIIDTACSSGLTALHTACRSIRAGECAQAIAGAVKIKLIPLALDYDVEIMSSDGRTRPFDDASDGTGSGEGVIAVLLKPLQHALRDGDHIHAVIKGSAVNQDGNSIGITAPNVEAQADVLEKAWQDAGLEPDTITYIEAHGTGTKLGDPIEIRGIDKAFRRYTDRKHFCAIGSVKANLGHMDNAAGLAGLVKALLALKHKQIPPLANFTKPNRQIDFDNSPVYVNTALEEWQPEGIPRRCGISSFGMSGTNCHVVLEEAPQTPETTEGQGNPHIFALSARTPATLKTLVQTYRDYAHSDVFENQPLENIVYTANTGRGHYTHRLAMVVRDKDDLKQKLHLAAGENTDLTKLEMEGYYYGHHRVVPLTKKVKGANEYTDAELRRLSETANEAIAGGNIKTEKDTEKITTRSQTDPDKGFCGGSRGAVFSKNAPLAAGGNINDINERLENVARYYIAGADIDWEAFYSREQKKHRKVSLPTYPFERKRCWLEPAKSQKKRQYNQSLEAALLDRCLVESENQEIYVTTFSPEQHWLLREHRVNGTPTMVGTGFLEQVMELWRRHYPVIAVEITNMTVMTPLQVPENEVREVQTVLQREADHMEFKVVSRNRDGEKEENGDNVAANQWHRHVSGRLSIPTAPVPEKYDIPVLREQFPTLHHYNAAEETADAMIQVGPRWHSLKTIATDGRRYLGYLELAEEYHGDLEEFHLHPPLMDAALHFALARINTDVPYLPMLYKKVRVTGKTPPVFYSLAEPKTEPGGETMVFDIQLMDTAGNVFAVFEDYTLKKVHGSLAGSEQPGANRDFYHETRWIPSPIKPAAEPETGGKKSPGAILAVGSEEASAHNLVKELIEKSGTPIQLFYGSPENLENLGERCSGTDFLRVVYQARSKTATDNPEEEAVRFFSLVKILVNSKIPAVEIVLLTRNAVAATGTEAEINPDDAQLIGLAKVVPQEYPHITARVIDSDGVTPAETILTEIESGGVDLASNADFTVAYRDNRRYVEEFGAVDLSGPAEEPVAIRENGVYIVTGGLGGIGLEIAKNIAAQKKVTLILLDRAPFPKGYRGSKGGPPLALGEPPEAPQAQLDILSEKVFGGSAVYKSADVSDEQRMTEVLEEVRRAYGAIHGVIHCAGMPGNGFIIRKDEESFRKVLAPKVQGTRLLDRLTREDRLDFFFLCSSLTTLTGAPGQSDYTAANSYQDAYAFYRNKQGHRTLAIDWTGWKEVGMAKNFGVNQDDLFKTILNKDGVRAFREVLDHRHPRVMVGTLDLDELAAGNYRIPARLSPELAERLERRKKQPAASTAAASSSTSSISSTSPTSTNAADALPEVKLTGRDDGGYTENETRTAAIWAGVLGFDEVNIYDNYYDLGGDSINALHIVNKANKILGADLSVADIFTHLTVEEFAGFIAEKYTAGGDTKKDEDSTVTTPELVPVKEKSYYPVSAAQGRLFILDRLDNKNTGYNLPEIRVIHGRPDIQKLEEAVNRLIRRHETLRTSFTLVDDVPVQVVHDAEDTRLKIKVTEILTNKSTDKSTDKTELEARVRDFVRPFDIGRAPLLRVELIKLEADEYILMMDIHHIIADAMGCEILLHELLQFYGGETPPELAVQYKDYAEWQSRLFSSGALENQKQYWLDQYGGSLPVLELPTDHPRPPMQSFEGDTVSFRLDETQTQQARTAAKSQSVTLYMMVLAAYYTILHRYSGQDDIVIGSAAAGRPHADLEKLIGMFINILPIRNYPAANKTFSQFLEEVKTSALKAFENQDYPFDQLVEELDVKRDFSRSPLVDVEFSYMSFDDNTMGKDVKMGDLTLKPYDGPLKDSSKADITLFCLDTDTILFSFEYCSAIFEKERMQRFADHFHTLMRRVIEEPDIQIGSIDLLSEEEKRQLTDQFNDTAADIPEDKTIHQLFEEQVERAPHRLATVEEENGTLTYEQLNQTSNRLAHHLQEKGIQPGTIVAIQMQASLDMLLAIMGILKTGAAYLPIDPAYPAERIEFMLKDSSAALLLNSEGLNDAINRVPTPGTPESDLPPLQATAPAYVIYTSGSTGKPKGVVIEHRSLVNLCNWHNREFEVTAADRASKYAGVGFDASVWEIFPYMVAGAALYIVPEDIKLDMEALNRFFEANGITVAFLPTQVCEEFIKQDNQSLRVLLTGGDKLNNYTPPRYRLENNYGPTENTVVSTSFTVERQYDNIPIGKPVTNTRAAILDGSGNLQPIGVPGELVLFGTSLARGYLNRPELTAEKFEQDLRDYGDYADDGRFRHSGRFYKTGDRARWLADGNIEFLGRIDHQVKIRGYRIETGEIESKLLSVPAIRESVVIAKSEPGDRGDKYLCAYIVIEPGVKTDDTQINSHLAAELPDYMIPSVYVRLDALPLTPNGKVDRKGLAAREDGAPKAPATSTTTTVPQSDTEKRIADTWKDVLNRDTVGIHDNFFDIGGNSLKLIKLTNRLKAVFNRDIPVVTLFRFTTVHTLAQYLLRQQSPPQGQDSGDAAASPAGPVLTHQHLTDTKNIKTYERSGTHREIAVIGMAGRFPGAGTIVEFWENLVDGVESITFFADRELQEAGVEPQLIQNPNYVKAGAPIPDRERFDAGFFGYTPREARIMDPQIRIFHETVVEALENAGYHPAAYDGSIGLYAGASSSYHWESAAIQSGQAEDLGLFASVNLMDRDFMSTRISYNLNLNGPAFTLQTACSTSLTAIHQASRALMTGECDIALAGGVSALDIGSHGYLYEEGMVESSDGHCRAFDAAADGTVFGSGAAAVVLKPLHTAQRDRDTIYAVIKGSAINNDGNRKVGYAAPSIEGQAEVIRKAQREAGIDAATVSYIETHGTGTALGDPVEVEALKLAFATPTGTDKRNTCGIGSVKTNIGHLDAAAGAAGFIKTVLSLHHRQLPPSLHYQAPNPAIDFENSPFYVNAKLQEWHSQSGPLRAGVSSFGIGGTNAHVVLEEAPKQEYAQQPDTVGRRHRLIQLSAKTKTALDQLTANLGRHLKKNIGKPGVTLANTAYTLAVGRGSHRYKRTLICTDLNEAVEGLLNPENASVKVETHDSGFKNETPPVIYMFPGQGAQYVDMARGLYETEPVFREEIDRCFEILETLIPHNIKEKLYPNNNDDNNGDNNNDGPDINQTEITQPLIFTIEYALARLLMAWGIEPHAMIGHSIGEYAAAHIAGVMTLEDALKLVAARGKLMQSLPSGSMLSVPLEESELQPYLKSHPKVSAAALNSTGRSVVSGEHEAINAFAEELSNQGHETRKLHTSHAFHSPMMDPILEEFKAEVAKITLHPPQIPYISNNTGQWIKPEDATKPEYYAAHLRGAVRFSTGIAELMKIENAQLVEVGPGNVLSTFARKHAACPKTMTRSIHNLVRHPRETTEDSYYLLQQITRLQQNNKHPNWTAIYSPEPLHRIPLPTYPFQRQHFPPIATPTTNTTNHELRRKPDIEDWFYIPSWERRLPECVVEETRSAGCLRRLSEGQGGAPLGTPLSLREVRSESVDWIVFLGQNDFDRRIGEAMVQRLKDDGDTVIAVKPGTGFKAVSSTEYILDPANDADYVSLFSELEKTYTDTDESGELKILHLWNVTGNQNENRRTIENNLDNAANHGLHSLLAIARAVGNTSIRGNIRIVAITDNLHDVTGVEKIQPEKAPLLAAVKIIPVEYPNIQCCGMDIHLPGTSEELVLERIMEEFRGAFTEPVVAFRGNHRWEQTMVPHRMKAPQTPGKPAARLKERGVYLITGGLGGIGLTHAQYLAQTVKARLILVSRTPFPPREEWETLQNTNGQNDPLNIKIRKLMEMEKTGAELLIVAADTSDRQQMAAVIAEAQQRFGRIDGILHTAGIVDQKGIIQLRNRKDTEEVMAPKVTGTLVLDELLDTAKPDFMVLYSSLAPHLYRSQFGQVGYVAANEFLDAYAGYKMQKDGVFTVAVDWTQWREVGMAVQADAAGNNEEPALQQGALTPAEGTAALERILASNQTRAAVSPLDLERLREHLDRLISSANDDETEDNDNLFDGETGGTDGTGSTRPEMSTAYAPPHSETEKRLAAIWRKFFGIDEIGIKDDFFELGGDSLLAVRIVSDVNKACKVKLQSHILMQEPTIEAVARKVNEITGKVSESTDSPESAAAIEQAEPQLTSLVPIQAGDGTKPALFMVHPIGGHVYFYRDLAVTLGPAQTVYGLQARGIEGNGEPIATIEEMAAHYIDEMQTVQPEGPYYLGGSSFGGMVVYEMERQLRNQNHETALLFMIDTPGPGHMPEKFQDDAEILAYYLNSENSGENSNVSPITPEQLRAQSEEERDRLVARQLELPGGAELSHILRVFNANFKAMFDYTPHPTPGKLVYFRAVEETPHNARTPEQAWIPLSEGGIDIHDIPGDHITMNNPPNIDKIGTILSSFLKK